MTTTRKHKTATPADRGLFLQRNGKFHTPPVPQHLKDFNAATKPAAWGAGLKIADGTAPDPTAGTRQAHAAKRTARAERKSLAGQAPASAADNAPSPALEPDRGELRAIAGESLHPFLSAVLGPSGVPDENPQPATKDRQYALFAIKHSGPGGWTPRSFGQFLKEFDENPVRACYVATATVTMGTHPRDGTKPALRHGNQHFVEQRFFVLDDIGTRVKHDDLPELLKKPTTIVETSSGNYQYAYRWATPIKDLALASEIIRAVYAAGATYGWDTGGALALKLVRVPVGVNGKRQNQKDNKGFADTKTWFPCRLVECHPERNFDPVEVAMTVGHDVNAPKNKSGRALNHLHRSEGYRSVSCDGIVDTFLEHMMLVGEVLGETAGGIYKEVVCPWAEKHSNPENNTAGYKPIGVIGTRGDEDSIYQRHFKCFHDSCSGHTTRDFIDYMQTRYDDVFIDPVPVFDPSAKLAREWAYVAKVPGYAGGAYIRLIDGRAWSVSEFTEFYRDKVYETKITLANLFRLSTLRLRFDRVELRPDIEAWWFADETGMKVLNIFRRVPLKSATCNLKFMDKWLARHQRLYGDASATILDGWAYKYQNPEWTGYAELGIGQVQGMGRTSFLQTYLDLWRPEYVATLPMKHLSLDWGNYQTKLLVIVNEVCASEASRFDLTEKFKEEIDSTQGRRVDVNIKGGRIIEGQRVFAHWIMFSNHLNSVYISQDDRRMLIADNGHTRPAEKENEDFWEGYWNQDREYSKAQLHYFLMDRDLSKFKPFADAPHTPMRERMVRETNLPGAMVDAILDNWLECAEARGISYAQVFAVLGKVMAKKFLQDVLPVNWRDQVRKHLESRTAWDKDHCRVSGGADRRKRTDVGVPREDPDGPPGAWCTKQNILLIPALAGADVPAAAVDVDWERLVAAVVDVVAGFSEK